VRHLEIAVLQERSSVAGAVPAEADIQTGEEDHLSDTQVCHERVVLTTLVVTCGEPRDGVSDAVAGVVEVDDGLVNAFVGGRS
jgi:hypothetical protein